MVQLFFIRADMSPLEAIDNGGDSAICGDCQHRGTVIDGRVVDRSCYVDIAKSVTAVYGAHARGVYPVVSIDVMAELLRDRRVRIGAYGDAACLPVGILDSIMEHVEAKTGYTHQWRKRPDLAKWCMASCDCDADYVEAKAAGWRTFRVRGENDPLHVREQICPANDEAGKRTTCHACIACGGTSAKARVDMAIIVHGAADKVRAFHSHTIAA